MVGPAALAWPHVAYLALLALIIRLALTKLKVHPCRGNMFKTRARFSGIMAQRRNSCGSSVSLREAPATPYISQVRRHGYLGLFGPMLHGLLSKRLERLRAVRPLHGRLGLRRGRDGQRPECAPDHCVRTPSPRQAPVHLPAASTTPRWRGCGDVVARDARPLQSRPAKRHALAAVSVVSRSLPTPVAAKGECRARVGRGPISCYCAVSSPRSLLSPPPPYPHLCLTT